MARVLSQALMIVVGGSSWGVCLGPSEGSLSESDEKFPGPAPDLPTDTDYYYDEAEVPHAMSLPMPSSGQRQNLTGQTRPRDAMSSPPNLSGAPIPGLNMSATDFPGRELAESTWDPAIWDFYRILMIYLWVEHHQSVGVALCLAILSAIYTFLAALPHLLPCCRRCRRRPPPDPTPSAPPIPSLGHTFSPAGRGGTGVTFEFFPPNCPRCGRVMALRFAQSGSSSNHAFWGCPQYRMPVGACSGTRDARVLVITRFE